MHMKWNGVLHSQGKMLIQLLQANSLLLRSDIIFLKISLNTRNETVSLPLSSERCRRCSAHGCLSILKTSGVWGSPLVCCIWLSFSHKTRRLQPSFALTSSASRRSWARKPSCLTCTKVWVPLLFLYSVKRLFCFLFLFFKSSYSWWGALHYLICLCCLPLIICVCFHQYLLSAHKLVVITEFQWVLSLGSVTLMRVCTARSHFSHISLSFH